MSSSPRLPPGRRVAPGSVGRSAGGSQERTLVFVCHGPSCSERGSPETCRRLREALQAGSDAHGVRVCETTCLDHCATGPNVVVGHAGRLIAGQLPEEASRLAEFLAGGRQPGT